MNKNNKGSVKMKNLTKVAIFLIVYFVITTAYAFAAFVGHQIKPLPEPINLLIFGIALVGSGYFFNKLNSK